MKAAIIGCGPSGPNRGGAHSISYGHAWAMVRAGKEISLVAAASRSEKNRADFVVEFPMARGYGDYREMLSEQRSEFVSVCAFPPDREEMVLAALDAGAKIIWVEKPFAISMGAAQRMLRAADEHQARLFVGFQRRFGKPFEWVKAVVAEGKIGNVVGAQINQPGNALINFGPHLIDAVLNVMNVPAERQPVRVFAAVEWSDALYQGLPIEKQLVGTVHFSDGSRVVIESGKVQAKTVPVLRFDGEQGFAELRLGPLAGENGMARGCFKGEAGVKVFESDEHFHHGATEPNLYMERALQDILHASRNGAPSRLDAATVLPGLEILLALFTSANRREMVALPLVTDGTPFEKT
jgi:predicted dehydrogenase